MTIAPFYMELTEEEKKLAEWWTKNVFQRPTPKKRRRRRKQQTQDSKKQGKDLVKVKLKMAKPKNEEEQKIYEELLEKYKE